MDLLPRLAGLSFDILRKIYSVLDGVLTGFWLGVLSEKSIERYNDLHYDKGLKYLEDDYNLTGLHNWEFKMLKKHFSKARTFLLLAAGGGRETAILTKWGVKVDSYECSEKFVAYGNQFLQRNHFDAKIEYLSKNEVPSVLKEYDGIIIGWGAYTHIRGRENRITLLKKLHPFCRKDTPVLLSFQVKEGSVRKDKIIKSVSDFFRFFSRSPKTETGDRLYSYFAHVFDRTEIQSELNQAGFTMIDYYDEDYGCAVAMQFSSHHSNGNP